MQKQEEINCLILSAAEVSISGLISQYIKNAEIMDPSLPLQSNKIRFSFNDTIYMVNIQKRIITSVDQDISYILDDKIDLCVYVYDISSRQSFEKIKQFINKTMNSQFTKGWIRNLIIAAEIFQQKRKVSTIQGEQISKQVGLFIELTSSKPLDFQYIYNHIFPVYTQVYPKVHQLSSLSASPSMPRKVAYLSDHYGKIINTIILGSISIGKSTFALSLAGQNTNNTYIPTIGVDFRVHFIEWEEKSYKIHFWQTSGAPRFQIITHSYLRSSEVIFIMYNSNDRQSFQKIHHYFKMCMDQSFRIETFKIIIVGNKFESKAEASIPTQEGQQLAQKLGCLFFQIDCRKPEQVQNCFLRGLESYLLNNPS